MIIRCNCIVLAMSTSEVESETQQTSEAPRFLQPISGTEGLPGKPAEFQVVVAGNPLPHVLWFREGHQIQHNGEFQVELFSLIFFVIN